MTLATRTRDYIARLVIGQGRHAGKPFVVLPWQARFLRGALACGVSESALSLARGGGKSTFAAGLGCAALCGPLAEPGAEVLIVASSHDQGGIIFRHVLRFLEPQIERGALRVLNSPNVLKIEHRETDVQLVVKGSDARRLHGAAPALIIADELSQWPGSRINEMLAALRTAAGKIPDSRMLMIGTRPAGDTHPFAVALRDADYCQVHAAARDDPPWQKRTWAKANPSLPHLPDLERAIAREAAAAKRDPALAASFRALRLNQGLADTEVSVLIDADLWAGIEGEAARAGACIWGMDLGTSAAQSAVAAFWPQTGRLEALAAFPNEPTLAERGARDGVAGLYAECERRGELIRCGRSAVEIAGLIREALTRYGAPARIVADRWRSAELKDALDAAGVPRAPLDERGQGYRDGGEETCASSAVRPLRAAWRPCRACCCAPRWRKPGRSATRPAITSCRRAPKAGAGCALETMRQPRRSSPYRPAPGNRKHRRAGGDTVAPRERVPRANAILSTARWARARKAAKDVAKWRCQRCGRPGRLEVHHRTPLERGGAPFDPGNLEVLCRGCHVAHHRPENHRRGRREPTAAELRWRDLVDGMRNVIT